MKLSGNLMDVYNVVSQDEELLRLLFYAAQDKNDDVLDDKRPNIIGIDKHATEQIINDVIGTSKNNDDLNNSDPKCRIALYFDAIEADHIYLNINLIIDTYVHYDYDKTDFRLSKILDRLSGLFHLKNVTGLWKINLTNSIPITDKEELYEGYVGHRMTLKIVDFA